MIGIIVTQEIKDQNELSNSVDSILTRGDYPVKWWGEERVVGGYQNRTDLHQADGWRDVVQPTIGLNQRRGPIFFDEPNDVFTYEVIDLTLEEIEANTLAAAESARQTKLQEQTIALADQTFQDITDVETVLANAEAYPLWRNFLEGHSFTLNFKVQDFNAENELKVYSVIQAHNKQANWFPRNVPSLFVLVQEEGATEWEVGAAYVVGDIRTYEGVEYICLQSHTAIAGWQPPNVPALWAVFNG